MGFASICLIFLFDYLVDGPQYGASHQQLWCVNLRGLLATW